MVQSEEPLSPPSRSFGLPVIGEAEGGRHIVALWANVARGYLSLLSLDTFLLRRRPEYDDLCALQADPSSLVRNTAPETGQPPDVMSIHSDRFADG